MLDQLHRVVINIKQGPTMRRFALVDPETKRVLNIVAADDPSIFQGVLAIELPINPDIGWTWDGATFVPPTEDPGEADA